MKVFIVFLAMLLLNMTFLIQWRDMDRYELLQKELKTMAEECASGAALYDDREVYSLGKLSIDQEAAEAYLSDRLEKYSAASRLGRWGLLEARMEIYDDVKGYGGAEAAGITGIGPAVLVELTYTGRDLFRLPFFCVTALQRKAVYQWEGGLTTDIG